MNEDTFQPIQHLLVSYGAKLSQAFTNVMN